jgi:hypothetical protein
MDEDVDAAVIGEQALCEPRGGVGASEIRLDPEAPSAAVG